MPCSNLGSKIAKDDFANEIFVIDSFNDYQNNKIFILTDILKGRGKFTAEWFLIILKNTNSISYALRNINDVLNCYDGSVLISPRGSLKIGNITMQRKGGDAGRDTANMLQFKINPYKLFNI